MIPHDTIDKLAATFASLTEFCADLSELQWKSPTQLPGWSVQDTLSHLVGIERSLQHLPGTMHQAQKFDYIKNPIGAANENEVDVRRSLTGAAVLAEWNEIVATRLNTLRTADDAYFAQESFTPTGPGTIADFLHIRVLDCWLHEQDMRRALHLPGHQSGPSAEHTIDRLIRTIPIVVGKRAATPEGESVIIAITGPVHRTIVATVTDGRAQLSSNVPPQALVTISMDSDTFVQLATGRASHSALVSGYNMDGDKELGTRIVSQFNMMI